MKTAPDIIFSRRADGSRDYMSDRFYEYTGASPDSATGFGWLEYVHPDDKDSSLAHWARCVESGEKYEREYRLRGRDGQDRWFRSAPCPFEIRPTRLADGMGLAQTSTTANWRASMRESAAELEKKVDESTVALRRLSNRLMTMQDDERRRIARELHDGLGQELVALKMLLNGIVQTPL